MTQAADAAAARSGFTRLRQHLAPTKPINGLAALGLPSFTASRGTVVYLRGTETLIVDGSTLLVTLGRSRESRSDIVAYTALRILWPDT
ncbi:MAG: hypothetical protein H0V07_09975 [Propionibacteriales bacterium]|nr:hypothetical protein [Propionibacteriales bacterium]